MNKPFASLYSLIAVAIFTAAGQYPAPAHAALCPETISTNVPGCELPPELVTVTSTGSIDERVFNSISSQGISNFGIINGASTEGISNDGVIITLLNKGEINAITYTVSNNGVIQNLANNGLLYSVGDWVIYNSPTGNIQQITNTDRIISNAYGGIWNGGQIGILNNSNGTIRGVDFGIFNCSASDCGIRGVIDTLINSGTITASNTTYGVTGIRNDGLIRAIENTGNISVITQSGAAIGIFNSGEIPSLNNRGTISAVSQEVDGYAAGMRIAFGGTISALVNSGEIFASATNTNGVAYGIRISDGGTIDTLTNTGAIYATSTGVGGSAFGIASINILNTLNNAQGGNNSGPATTALTYQGALPTNYNIIINSPTHYGQLLASAPSGTVANFGIYGTPFITSRTYTSVLSNNVTVDALQAKYDNMTLALVNNATTNSWDLTFTGASLMGTQQSLVNTATSLQNTYTLQNSVLVNSFSYDCNVFGANNVCVSAGGRNTAVSAANGLNNTSGLLIAAYRPHPSYRIGAYADQNLSVNNAGSTVNLGNNTPLLGIFGAWNERLDGTATEVKVSAAYGQKNATVTRQVVGLSEAGAGGSQLNSQGAQVTAKYGFDVTSDVIVSPYVGMRYTQNNMGGYTEATTSSVTAPLTYSALNTNATTALAGVGASYRFIPQATAFASAGVETDTNTNNGTYSATGIAGLTAVNFNPNPVKTRATATLGAYYDIEKNQRVGITGIYRQEPYQSVQTTTVMATYTIGL